MSVMENPALIAAAATFCVVAGVGVLEQTAHRAAARPEQRLWRPIARRGLAGLLADRRRRLDLAGLRTAPQRLTFTLLSTAAVLAGALAGALLAGERAAVVMAAWAVGGALLANMLSRAWLSGQRARLLARRSASMPAAMELLCIGVEGGLGLHAAWQRVADGLELARDPLAEEFRRIDLDVRLSTSWRSSLEQAAERTQLASFAGIGQVLEQAEQFGSELSASIKLGVDSLVHDSMQELEERAHRSSVKMLIPLAACMLPATLLLVLGPLLALVLDALKDANAG